MLGIYLKEPLFIYEGPASGLQNERVFSFQWPKISSDNICRFVFSHVYRVRTNFIVSGSEDLTLKVWSLKGVHKHSQGGDVARLKVKYTQLAHDKVNKKSSTCGTLAYCESVRPSSTVLVEHFKSVFLFLTIYEIAKASTGHVEVTHILELFVVEVGGGIVLGLVLGFIGYRLMKSIDDYAIEVMVTLALVMGGYLLALKLHISGPLAMVTAGLIVGNDTVRDTVMSEITETYVDKFWELVDVLCNAILFVLIGLEILILTYDGQFLVAGLIAIPIVLFSRYLALSGPIKFFSKKLEFVPHTNLIMTWGGLRGGISIALALSLTDHMHRELFMVMTYVVVVFSILFQGLTVGKLVERLKIGG